MSKTEWKLFYPKEGVYKHNHIEDGINENPKPTPKHENQKIWLDQDWAKKFI
jgi:hypothetical protein